MAFQLKFAIVIYLLGADMLMPSQTETQKKKKKKKSGNETNLE